VGSEKLSGVLYHFSPREKAQQFASVPSLLEGVGSEVTTTGLEIQIYGTKKEHAKDPNTRKRTRTGYNIYLKEQGARLKELYPGSKGLGKKLIEMWNKLPEEEKSVSFTLLKPDAFPCECCRCTNALSILLCDSTTMLSAVWRGRGTWQNIGRS
jgi:hypothetical protein